MRTPSSGLLCVASLLKWIVIFRENNLTPVIILLSILLLCIWKGVEYYFLFVSVILILLKHIYIHFLRPDEHFDCPVWDKITFPALGAHRGGSFTFGPENTLYNFRKCVYECQVDIIEMDLRLTADGKIILMHDNFVDRTTDGRGLVSSFTLEEIKVLNAGWHYPDLRSSGITVPTLDEVLYELIDTNVIFFFDIKDPDVVSLLPDIISQWNLQNRLILGTVDPRPNEHMRKIIPTSIPLAPDFLFVLKMTLLYIIGLSWVVPTQRSCMGTILIDLTKYLMPPGLISEWKSRNWHIIVFGDLLNEAEHQREWIQNGVDILLTDLPDVGRMVLGPSKNVKEPIVYFGDTEILENTDVPPEVDIEILN